MHNNYYVWWVFEKVHSKVDLKPMRWRKEDNGYIGGQILLEKSTTMKTFSNSVAAT